MELGDIKNYLITTGHGSKLKVRFQLTGYYDESKHKEDFMIGQAIITGLAKSLGKLVNFGGMCWVPEVGGYIAVGIKGKDKNGLNIFHKELIKEIEELD